MKKRKNQTKRSYQKPVIKSEKEHQEVALNCPTTNTRYCGYPYSPKKG